MRYIYVANPIEYFTNEAEYFDSIVTYKTSENSIGYGKLINTNLHKFSVILEVQDSELTISVPIADIIELKLDDPNEDIIVNFTSNVSKKEIIVNDAPETKHLVSENKTSDSILSDKVSKYITEIKNKPNFNQEDYGVFNDVILTLKNYNPENPSFAAAKALVKLSEYLDNNIK